MSFWRPSAWDLIGALLGVVSLVAGSTIIVQLSVTATQLLLSILAIALIIASALIFFRLKEHFAFPFQISRFDSTLTFSVDPLTGVPVGKIKRNILVKMHRGSPKEHTWGFSVTDPSELHVPDLVKQMGIHAEIKAGPASRKLKPKASLSEFRRLNLVYPLPEEVLHYRKFSLAESSTLFNDFSQDDESFDMAIMELAKRRTIRFEFDSINVKSARIAVIRGKRDPIYKSVTLDRKGSVVSFEKEFRRTRIGDVLSVRWNWNYRSKRKSSRS